MTKKDYEVIAEVFAKHIEEYKKQGETKETGDKVRAINALIADMSCEFEIENPRFLRGRFADACGFSPSFGFGK